MTDLIKTLNDRGLHNDLRLSVAEDGSPVTDCVFSQLKKQFRDGKQHTYYHGIFLNTSTFLSYVDEPDEETYRRRKNTKAQ